MTTKMRPFRKRKQEQLLLEDAHGVLGLVEEEAEISLCDDPLQEWLDEVTGALQDLMAYHLPNDQNLTLVSIHLLLSIYKSDKLLQPAKRWSLKSR